MPSAGPEYLDRKELARVQEYHLRELLGEIWRANAFYSAKFAGIRRDDVRRLADLDRLPFTTKDELLADQQANPPYGRNLTYPLARYRRLHQTSGTTGKPLRWLDTADSWNRMLQCWQTMFRWLGINEEDRLLFPFSFGPFLGFWTAFEAAGDTGCLCLPGGGMTSVARLNLLRDNQATVVLCTPTYALRLAESAREHGIPLGNSVRALIVAGEPGGSIPATRRQIENAWQARVFDHSGATEIGPMTIECRENPCGLHLLEEDYLAEVIDPATGQMVSPGQVGELVVTTLHRWGSPLVRYCTGDLVRVDPQPCPCGRTFIRFDGGILGRTDDMIHVRGNNVYPGALEGVIRRFAEVAEFRMEVDQTRTLTELRIEVEAVAADLQSAGSPKSDLPERIAEAMRAEFLFRPAVVLVPPGTLPRFEMKARRFHKKEISR